MAAFARKRQKIFVAAIVASNPGEAASQVAAVQIAVDHVRYIGNLWTHASTAIEGNTLTLGETAFVLQEGLVISGKPLKDHEEVVGHARAIDLVYQLVENDTGLSQDRLFTLHKAVQTQHVIDVYIPDGAWKKEPNSTVMVVDDRQIVFEYAPPGDVPELMGQWFELYDSLLGSVASEDSSKALNAHVDLHVSFVRIHSFFNANGRLARLLANVPVLKAGLPPIIIPKTQQKTYIDALSAYHMVAGQALKEKELLPSPDALGPFVSFCKQAWGESLSLVEVVRKIQEKRDRKK